MKYLLLLGMVVVAALFAGCDDKPGKNTLKVAVEYDLDRNFTWEPEQQKLSGVIRVKVVATTKDMPSQSIVFSLPVAVSPGERKTILVMTDEEGVNFTGEYPDLPIQMPRLLQLQAPDVYAELVETELTAACEVALSIEPYEGRHCFVFSCFLPRAGWLHDSSFEFVVDTAFSDGKFIPYVKGEEEVRRLR